MSKVKKIIDGLNQCTEDQKHIFYLMYRIHAPEGNLETLVKSIPKSKLDWALTQVQNTIKGNLIPKQPKPVEVPVVIPIEKRMERTAFDAADDDFFENKKESRRDVEGGAGAVDFEFEGKKYTVAWKGWWESSDWYQFVVTGENVNFKGVRYLDD